MIKCLRKAQKRQQSLVLVLIRHEDELDSIKTILEQLSNNENSDLRTAGLGIELIRMQQIQHKLAALLKELDPGSKSRINQYARQLLEGSADEKNLSSLMEELGQIKASILLCIQMTNVGVIRDMNKQIVADAVKIERIDSNLQEMLDGYEGLRIAQLISGRRRSSKLPTTGATFFCSMTSTVDGTIPLTKADLQSLSSTSTDSDDASDTLACSSSDAEEISFDIPKRLERIILRNMTRDQSLQINGPVGEDIWKDITRLEIRENEADGFSTQVNYPITIEVFRMLLENPRLDTKRR